MSLAGNDYGLLRAREHVRVGEAHGRRRAGFRESPGQALSDDLEILIQEIAH